MFRKRANVALRLVALASVVSLLGLSVAVPATYDLRRPSSRVSHHLRPKRLR